MSFDLVSESSHGPRLEALQCWLEGPGLSGSFWGSDVAELDLGIRTGSPIESFLTAGRNRISQQGSTKGIYAYEEGASTGDERSNNTI